MADEEFFQAGDSPGPRPARRKTDVWMLKERKAGDAGGGSLAVPSLAANPPLFASHLPPPFAGPSPCHSFTSRKSCRGQIVFVDDGGIIGLSPAATRPGGGKESLRERPDGEGG